VAVDAPRKSLLREYPTPDSVWDGSNEIVLAIQEKAPVPAQNVHPLNVVRAAPTPVPILSSKTRLKLTAADRQGKFQLQDDLLDAETALLKAYEAFRAGSGEWTDVERSDRDYRQVIDGANTFIATIHEDQEDYFSERTEKWQESEKGQAYQEWMNEWDIEISPDELPEPEMDGDLELYALEMLQELPEEP
jgi:hypothetical protein